ncbi:MAG: acetate/propionate family kinase [Acidobacteriota bacterium]|nr:acetate/propionate family kinase [Acidobacteriota bacterium]
MADDLILVINTGSSSLKLGVYEEADGDEQLLLEGGADGIGAHNGTLKLNYAEGQLIRSEELRFGTQQEALGVALGWVSDLSLPKTLAIGHRVVHGGPHLTEHQRITPELIRELHRCVHFAPIHIPMALSLIQAAEKVYPHTPQFACFDTAFHRTLPEAAARFPLAGELFKQGVRRYGFHGLSYESIVHRLGPGIPSRTVIAHLGSGASLAALCNGRSVDTSMGLTPVGGIMMGTRSGDLDPGVLLYILRAGHVDADALERILNHDAGLKAISGGESDMRALEAKAAAGDTQAQLAIEMFCIAIRKVVASYATVLDGLDLLVFTGGIGEHSSQVRDQVCRRLGFMGVCLDSAKNSKPDGDFSADSSTVRLKVVKTEEDRQISRHCRAMLSKTG